MKINLKNLLLLLALSVGTTALTEEKHKTLMLPDKPFQIDDTTVLLWHLDRGPNARNKVPSGVKGTVTGAQWVKGKFRACLLFNGKNSSVQAGLGKIQFPQRCLELWINPEKSSNDKSQIIWNEVESPGCSTVLLLDSDGYLNWQRVYCGKNMENIKSSRKIAFNQWSWVKLNIVQSKKTVSFTINGKPAGKGSMPLSGNASRISLGGTSTGEAVPHAYFKGKIDEIRLSAKKRKKQ